MSIQVRPGSPGDVAFVIAGIRQLAAFEKLEHLFEGDGRALAAHLFGERPSCELLVGEIHGERLGYALYFTTYSTFLTRTGLFLEDLFVVESARGQGLGRALLVELARVAIARDCGRVEWSVLDWNAKAIAVYDSVGARPLTGWIPYRLDGEVLAALARG
jgi:GNAT superfamily N-acetyltransferase